MIAVWEHGASAEVVAYALGIQRKTLRPDDVPVRLRDTVQIYLLRLYEAKRAADAARSA